MWAFDWKKSIEMRKLLDRIPFKFVNLIYWLLLSYLVAALGVLARYYGYERGLSSRGKRPDVPATTI